MPLDQLWQQIDRSYEAFSPQLRRAARYVRDHPQDVAVRSLRTLATQAGVSPTSMTRLLQALEFTDFDTFQEVHRSWLTQGGGFSQRADRFVREMRSPEGETRLLDELLSSEQRNLARTLDPSRRPALMAAATLIASAPTVAVAGMRSCFPVAFGLNYALSLVNTRTMLLSGTGGLLADEIHHLRAGDVLIVISVSPYTREMIATARLAARRGIRVVAVTDGHLTPLARVAEIVLVADNEGPGHIASPIGPFAVAQALSLLVLARLGDDGMGPLHEREALLEEMNAYVSEEQPDP